MFNLPFDRIVKATDVKLMASLPFGQIAKVTDTQTLIIKDRNGKKVVNAEINSLKRAWQKTFDW
jgi:hypothetical protein